MYGRRDSRTTKPRQVQLVVVMAKICPSAATVLFPRMITNKRIRRLTEAEFDFALPRGERRSKSSSQVTVAGTVLEHTKYLNTVGYRTNNLA